MRDLVDKIIKINISEIKNYNFPENELFGLEILENNVKYEFLIKLRPNNNKLICFGAKGGLDREKRDLPDFPRFSWHNSFQESLIYYADPTFYISKEIKTGWYMGTEDNWYLERIAEIILKIVENFEVENKNILFYGTSVGGFSSIMLATLFKKSTALVGNPQILISNHYDSPYNNIKKYCFNDQCEEKILEKYSYRFNVFDLFKRESYIPHIIYLVNAKSKRDLYKQCVPFIRELGKLSSFNDNDVEVIIYHDKDGHVGRVTRTVAIPLIKLVLDRKIYYYEENITTSNNDIVSEKLKERDILINKQKDIINDYKSRKIVKFADKLNNLIKKIFKHNNNF